MNGLSFSTSSRMDLASMRCFTLGLPSYCCMQDVISDVCGRVVDPRYIGVPARDLYSFVSVSVA